ncbi:MAG: hypothetical protein LBQ59_03075 [Candidatus Peribacteria bacterium]|jgi:hypothetical protein|nr:hypothetical protein [Candidatus Peribacteria bacterium]
MIILSSSNPFSPDPRVDSRFNLSGCPRMTYEDDIRVEGEENLLMFLSVASSFQNVFPFPVSPFGRDKSEGLTRGKELRIGVNKFHFN